jgi:murein DD-endopeptidase MepM/ murein hydrolase activator NlpD
VSPAHQYKKLENEIVDSLEKRLRILWQNVVSFFKTVYQRGRQRFTVMFIPHSEKRIFNFQISVFTLIFVVFLLGVLLVGFIVLTTHFTSTNDRFLKMARSLDESEASLESFKDEGVLLRRSIKDFKARMESVLAAIGDEQVQNYLQSGVGGDLSSLVSLEDVEGGTWRDLSELRSLRSYLDNSVEPLGEIEKVLQAQRDLLANIPTYWPLKGVPGNITQRFGFAKNPFTGGWYLHKGLDIAWGMGVPIVATANGKVQRVANDPMGLGWYVLLRHNYGFHTRYGHLDGRILVKEGQEVRRGQVIGYMGNSGLSTGPHLHYEVVIGTQVVDPEQFLNIRSPLIQSSVIAGK